MRLEIIPRVSCPQSLRPSGYRDMVALMAELPGKSETKRLIEQAVRGDQQALGELLGRHRERLRRVIALRLDWRLRGRLDPSDVLQEVDSLLRTPPGAVAAQDSRSVFGGASRTSTKENEMPFYMRVTGTNQGRFRGGIARKNRGDNWYNILSLNFDKMQKDLQAPIQITKVVDSQAFFFAQTQGEILPLVEIDLVRLYGNGGEIIERTFKLTNVSVAAYNQGDGGANTNVEAFSLAFKTEEVAYNREPGN
jgi:type VI protein secretion system component Hcp